jgi:hypothetical protein
MKLKKTFEGDKDMDRREFLKKSGQTALAICTGLTLEELVSGCATPDSLIPGSEAGVIYPALSGQKIQPPEVGCYIGFEGVWERSRYAFVYTEPRQVLSAYQDQIGKVPITFMNKVANTMVIPVYPEKFMEEVHEVGCIPFSHYDVNKAIHEYGSLEALIDNQDFIDETRQYAREVSDHKIPHFVSTMRNPNGTYFPWCGRRKEFIRLWRDIWQIFEDEGANQYATWKEMGGSGLFCWHLHLSQDH